MLSLNLFNDCHFYYCWFILSLQPHVPLSVKMSLTASQQLLACRRVHICDFPAAVSLCAICGFKVLHKQQRVLCPSRYLSLPGGGVAFPRLACGFGGQMLNFSDTKQTAPVTLCVVCTGQTCVFSPTCTDRFVLPPPSLKQEACKECAQDCVIY